MYTTMGKQGRENHMVPPTRTQEDNGSRQIQADTGYAACRSTSSSVSGARRRPV
jgi:hypothetical protein